MSEQRVNAAGETVEYNDDSGRWEPVNKEEAKPEAQPQDVVEPPVAEDNSKDAGLPVSQNYTPRV